MPEFVSRRSRLLAGVVSIHRHNGKHRGPAAAAVVSSLSLRAEDHPQAND
jgi:hypothetical protein